MFGRSEFLERVDRAVEAALAAGERRCAAAFLRGPGPSEGLGSAGRRDSGGTPDSDWVLVVTDRRVLLLPATVATRPAAASADVRSFPRDGVRIVDATLRGAAPVLVLRFPDAVLGWFHPVSAWRQETEQVIEALRGDRPDDDSYPEEDRRDRAPTAGPR